MVGGVFQIVYMVMGYLVSILSRKQMVASLARKLYLLKKIPNVDEIKRK